MSSLSLSDVISGVMTQINELQNKWGHISTASVTSSPVSTRINLCASTDSAAAGCNPIIGRRKRHLHLPHALLSEQIIQQGDGLQAKSHWNGIVWSGPCALRAAVSCSGSFRVIRDKSQPVKSKKDWGINEPINGSTYPALTAATPCVHAHETSSFDWFWSHHDNE